MHARNAGVNNDFLVKTKDPLAITYNDRSPMVRDLKVPVHRSASIAY